MSDNQLAVLGAAITEFERLGPSALLPSHVRSAGDAALLCATAVELGLPPLAGLRAMYMVDGRVHMYADAMMAVALRHAACEYIHVGETSAERCVVEARRRGAPGAVTITYTAEDAKRANLWDRAQWRKYPRQMLRARALAEAVRAVFADALMGVYTPDELDDFAPPTPPSPEERAATAERLVVRRAEYATETQRGTSDPAPSHAADVVDAEFCEALPPDEAPPPDGEFAQPGDSRAPPQDAPDTSEAARANWVSAARELYKRVEAAQPGAARAEVAAVLADYDLPPAAMQQLATAGGPVPVVAVVAIERALGFWLDTHEGM